jgi:hypothetical protein
MAEEAETKSLPTARGRWWWWKRLGLPLQVGIGAGLAGATMALIGMLRGFAPLTATSLLLALLISGGSWGLVAWAVTSAAVDSDVSVEDEPHAHEEGQEKT